MVSSLLLALLAYAAAPHPGAVGRVLVLEPIAPTVSAADRERLETRMETVLRAGNLAVAGKQARSAARACETQVCLERTASSYGITHWLRAEIDGDDREYRVRLAAGQIGVTTPAAQSAGECLICGMDDLAAAIEARTVTIRAQLSAEPAGPTPGARAGLTWRPLPGPMAHRDRRPGSALRPTGIALLALGSAGALGGAVMIGIDGQDVRRRCDGQNLDVEGDCRYVHETRAGGIAMLTGGVLAVAGGITLLTVERNRRHRADLRVRVGYNRIVFAGRF
jgi:hypothetical protein